MKAVVLYDAPAAGAPPDALDVLVQVELVERCLAELGIAAEPVAAPPDVGVLASALAQRAPDVVFNLAESYGGRADCIHWVAEVLESLELPFTGASSAALLLTTDKLAAKRALVAAGLPMPETLTPELERCDAEPRGRNARWILKPVSEDASVGIDDAACVAGSAIEVQRMLDARSTPDRPLFAEAFIEGRELNLSLLSTPQGLRVLPAAEIVFDAFPPGKPRIVGYDAKWSKDSFEYRHTPRCFERPLREPALLSRLELLAVRAFEATGCAGYARVDFRVTERGEAYILEVNANPCLAEDAGFMAAAGQAGLSATRAIESIVGAALARHRAECTSMTARLAG